MTGPSSCTAVETAAEYLQQRFGAHLAALMAYGSRVFGRARSGSAYDFWLIARDVEAFHRGNAAFYRSELNVPSTPEEQMALNRDGPLFYSVKANGLEMKTAVVGEEAFCELCRDEWWTVKGRVQKPLRVFFSTPQVSEAVLSARREGLLCAVGLLPKRFSVDEMLHELVGLSYRAEVRPENKAAKVHSIVTTGRAQLEEIYLPLLDELPCVGRVGSECRDLRSDEERLWARAATLRSLRRSKWCKRSLKFVWRNFRSHSAPIRYIVKKLFGEIEKAARPR